MPNNDVNNKYICHNILYDLIYKEIMNHTQNDDTIEDEIEVHPKEDGLFSLPKELFNDL